MLAGGPSAERLLCAHRAGFSQLSQRQLEQLIANPAPLPDMDPSVCGMCGFWVRRCTCRANVPHSAPYVEEDGLLGSLPRELLLLIGQSCSITMLGHLACVSKELRQLAYSECLWSALHAAAPWAPAKVAFFFHALGKVPAHRPCLPARPATACVPPATVLACPPNPSPHRSWPCGPT